MGTATEPQFLERLVDRGVLVADGATATSYQAMGLEAGAAPEEWILSAPERVLELHRAYVDAGADVILTCSFGGTRLRLDQSGLGPRAREVNLRAAALACEASGGRALVAGSLGPTGELCEPLGELGLEECAQNYAEQAAALTEGGVDLLLAETFYAVEEATAAVEGIRSVSALPLVVTFSFDTGRHTMMGLSPADAVDAMRRLGVAAIGSNCGSSLEDSDLVVEQLIEAAGDLPVWVKPNAGIPRVVGLEVVYDADPETFASHAYRYVEQGARIIGGCCGTTPAHVAAIRRALGPT